MANLPRPESISQAVAVSGFTDELGQEGFIDFDDTIPPHSLVLGWEAEITTRFTGGLGEHIEIVVGEPGDEDAFSANGWKLVQGVPNWLSDVPRSNAVFGEPSLKRFIRVSLRDLTDFNNIAGGALTIELFYLRTRP